ncbi:bifunctional nuclease family protein [bacterium]|nr:bifunctional nuclease family protein [bacterium]
MIEVEIDSVRVSLTNQQRIVILKEKDQERFLPIWIGLYEAEAITIALQEIQVARPQTHDLLKTLIQNLNGRLIQVEVVSLSDDVFYGSLILEVNGEQKQVDCRPSDALALAARTQVPILISEDVMRQAAIIPEEDIYDDDLGDAGSEEELEDQDLDVFENFLQNYDIGDPDTDIDPDSDVDTDEDVDADESEDDD